MLGNRCCLPIIAALAVAGSVLLPGNANAGPECRGEDGLNTPVVHGTVQAAVNGEGQLVLALDQSLPGACRPDGRAELVFLFQPRARDGAAGLARHTAEPVQGATIEHPGHWIRVTLPGAGTWVLTAHGADSRPAAANANVIDGLAVSRVDRGIRASGIKETLAQYREFDLVQGPGDG